MYLTEDKRPAQSHLDQVCTPRMLKDRFTSRHLHTFSVKLQPIREPLVLAGNYFNFISAFGGEAKPGSYY